MPNLTDRSTRDARTWTHGCDACGADAPVEYVAVLGYLCAFCRRPESIEDLRRELRPDPMAVIDAEAERLDPGHLGRVIADQRRALAEMRTVLGALLNLIDPPGEAKRRHHDEDERGFWMSVSGSVQIGRQLIPRPEACRMCRGGGADEYGAECSDCDGEGYDAKTPLTEAERRVWDAIARNVAERAKEE